MIVSLIAAVDDNYGIGQGGRIPWRLSEDLKRFKSLTMGHHVIMGRKTYQSIGKLLPGRTMIVVSRRVDFNPGDVVVVNSIDEALGLAERNGEKEVFVIGGGEVFKQVWQKADRLYLTHVHTRTDSDVFFPRLDEDWKIMYSAYYPATDQDEYPSTFRVYHHT